jgi:starvation-inducible outer membrane lipoprotein
MPRHQGLGIMNKQAKQMFKFIDKVDDKGNIVMIKGTNQPAQERKLVNVEYEYFMINKEEISNIIELFATNLDSFDYKKYFIDMKVKEEVEQ